MTPLIQDINWSLHRKEKLTDKHHLWQSADRDTADYYGLYVYLDHEFHLYEVHKHRKAYTKKFCELLNLDFTNINKLFKNKPVKYWDEIDIAFMENVKQHIENIRGEYD